VRVIEHEQSLEVNTPVHDVRSSGRGQESQVQNRTEKSAPGKVFRMHALITKAKEMLSF
jgi:hypothetical protein